MGCGGSKLDKGAVGGITPSQEGRDAADAAAGVLGTAEFTSQVELSIGCRNLLGMDITRWGRLSEPVLMELVCTRAKFCIRNVALYRDSELFRCRCCVDIAGVP